MCSTSASSKGKAFCRTLHTFCGAGRIFREEGTGPCFSRSTACSPNARQAEAAEGPQWYLLHDLQSVDVPAFLRPLRP